MRVNKNLIVSASLLCLLSRSSLALASGINKDVSVSHEITPKGKYALIEINPNTIGGIKVKNIKLPNGKVVKKGDVVYRVDKSGIYEFEIRDNAGGKSTYSLKVDLSKEKFLNKFIAEFKPMISIDEKEYVLEKGDYLNIKWESNKDITELKLNIDGIDEIPFNENENNASFLLNHIKDGVYSARLKGVDLNTGKEVISNDFKLTIGSALEDLTNLKVKALNNQTVNSDIETSKSSYDVSDFGSVEINYSTKNRVTVDYPKLNINGQDIFANYYSEGKATFYLNNLPDGIHSAKLKGFTYSGNEYISNEFKVKKGASNEVVPPAADLDSNKPPVGGVEQEKPPVGGVEQEKPSSPSTTKNSLSTTKNSYDVSDFGSIEINYSTKNGVTVDYPKLNINGQDIFANYYSEGKATFYLNNLPDGIHSAKLKGFTYSGNEYISNEFKVKKGSSNEVVPPAADLDSNNPTNNISSINVYGDKFFMKSGNTIRINYDIKSTKKVGTICLNIAGKQISPISSDDYSAEFYIDSDLIGYNLSFLTGIDSNGKMVKSNEFIIEVVRNENETSTPALPPSKKYSPKDSMSAERHEGIPNGAPVDWKYKPRVENLVRPNGWNAVGQWGQIYLEEGCSYPKNTAIEIANFKMYGYSESTKQWKLINHSIPGDMFYVEDFAGDANRMFPNKIKKDFENKVLTVKLDEDTKGYNLHPFSNQIDTKKAGLPDVKYVVSQMDVRLVKWDKNGVDDRDSARYVANVGGDWWRNVGDVWQPDWSTNKGIAQGQFRTITKDWKTCYMTNIPVDIYDQIIN